MLDHDRLVAVSIFPMPSRACVASRAEWSIPPAKSSPHYWGVRGAKAARQTDFDAFALTKVENRPKLI